MSDDRIKKSPGEAHASRESQDRNATEDWNVATTSERLEAFRNSFHQSHLPDLPCPPGYKVCWLTTTNPRDSIQLRMRLGYELLQAKDVPGYETSASDDAMFPGTIKINEMIAAKLPIDLYQMYMREAHAVRPAQEEERMNAPLKAIEEAAKEAGVKVAIGDETDKAWI
jgi:hypothetical protein